MLAKINKGQLVLLNMKKSCENINGYFKLNKINKKGYGYFISLFDIMVQGEYDKKGCFIVRKIFDSFSNLLESTKKKLMSSIKKDDKENEPIKKGDEQNNKKNNNQNKSKNKKHNKEIVIEDNKKEIKRVLWVSRHNMITKAYLDLQRLYPDYAVCVYPCQPRVLEGKTIYELAEKYECNVICAILSDNIFDDLASNMNAYKYTILKPIITVDATNRDICPKHSLNKFKEKNYVFHNWYDVQTKQNILFVNKKNKIKEVRK